MTEEKANEMVLCLSLENIKKYGNEQNCFAVAAQLAFADTANHEMVRRGEAETSTTHVQVIPYCLLLKGDRICAYRRSKSGGEARLHDKMSVGLGGHINQADMEDERFTHPIAACVMRELHEEVTAKDTADVPWSTGLRNIAWFYDDSNEVSRVHICNLVGIELPASVEISPREESVTDIQWLTLDELRTPEVWECLESWSQVTVEIMEHIVSESRKQMETTTEPSEEVIREEVEKEAETTDQ